MEKVFAEKTAATTTTTTNLQPAATTPAAIAANSANFQIGSLAKSEKRSSRKCRKLIRSPENVSTAAAAVVAASSICCDIPVSVVATIAATVTDVMGGGFPTPPPAKVFFDRRSPTDVSGGSEAEQRVKISGRQTCSSAFGESPSSTLFSSSALAGLGRVAAPSFFLDSPDEPPDFEYQHFSATDSSNSQEGSCGDFVGDFISDASGCESSTLSYCGLLSTQSSSMGGEVSTNSAASGGGGGNKPQLQTQTQKKQLHHQQQSSTKSEGMPTTTTASRSCSLTSDSGSTKFTRLQNFLFKSSESSKSFHGYSNDGYAASSHGSSSGEWESVITADTVEAIAPAPPPVELMGSAASEPASWTMDAADTNRTTTATTEAASAAANYYQYSLTSPNNPFLPEIIARSYHSDSPQQPPAYDDIDASLAPMAAGGAGTTTMQSPKVLSPSSRSSGGESSSFSRTGSAEEAQQQQQQPNSLSRTTSGAAAAANTASSPGGRHKRKLFLLNSPVRSGASGTGNEQKDSHPQRLAATASKDKLVTSPQSATTPSPSPSPTSTIRHLNPFIGGSSSHQLPPNADLNIKREEFLRATMKICLVVSPPANKLQLKSKSLTHLDGLDSIVACHHEAAGKVHVASSEQQRVDNETKSKPITCSSPLRQHPHPQTFPYPQSESYPPPRPTICASGGDGGGGGDVDTLSPNLIPTTTVAICCNNQFCSCHHDARATGRNGECQQQQQQRSLNFSSKCDDAARGRVAAASESAAFCASRSTSRHALSPICVTTITGGFFPFGNISTGLGGAGPGAGAGAGGHAPTTLTIGHLTTAAHESSSSIVPAYYTSISGPTTMASTPTSQHKKKSSLMQHRKKPTLTRSEVSSSEYFSVSFCTETGCQDEEFFPATKGVTLSDALGHALRRRNLSFSQILITSNNLPNFPESGSSSYTSSFDENTEVENLVGRHLIVSERDGSKKTLQKAASFGSRTRPPRLLSSASTEETSESADQRIPGKQLKQRWSGLFGIKNPQQSQLCELLNSYAKNGVPQKSTSVNFDHPDFDAALEYLDKMHKSWKDFVHCDDRMPDHEVKIQTAIWELVTTEVYYIHALQTVTDLFLACLEAIQEEKLLADVDQNRLFSNIHNICEANLKFWTLYLYPMVAHSIATSEPMRVDIFRPGFESFATIFAPYKKYCAEQSTCQFYCKELNRNNALFTSYLAWCESQKMCNRLRLADILVRPMQRLTKYSLLLAAIRKHVTDLESAESLDTMMHTVENFVCSVNNHLTTRQENERLKGVMARIESYDAVDTNNEHLDKLIKQYSQMFDLCAPMKGSPTNQARHLFMEGDHKFKDNLGKADVHCFLLTDMLLVCKSIAKKGLGALKIIRQPYLTDRLVVQHNHSNILNCVYLNEFQVAVTAFTLQCSEAKNWHDSLKRAKLIYTRLKQGSNHWENLKYGGSSSSGGGGGVGGTSIAGISGGPGGLGSTNASGGNPDMLGVKKSPMNSSICSHVSSTNNSHSGSVEWNESRNISVEFEKTNSLSSDEGSNVIVMGANQGYPMKLKALASATSPHKHKMIASSNTLSVEPVIHLGQSLPNLNFHQSQSNNTLLVPGTASSHSGNLLLSPSHRGKSYPPPSPPRATLRRGMAVSASIKNPPLVKTRNITSQNSINWHQIPATPTPTSPTQTLHQQPSSSQQKQSTSHHGQQQQHATSSPSMSLLANSETSKQPSTSSISSSTQQMSSETDV